jgi:hypothetical protein
MSKSRPTYQPLTPDPAGRRHLLVIEAGADSSAARGAREGFDEIWIAASGSPASAAPAARVFATVQALHAALERRLNVETMGFRLYAEGSEAFIWDVVKQARDAGMGRAEVYPRHVGAPVRRVYCVHCGTMIEAVAVNLVECQGCHARLSVREHFSRRLSAFMGVQADAETPGVLPAAEAFAG